MNDSERTIRELERQVELCREYYAERPEIQREEIAWRTRRINLLRSGEL